LNALTASLLAAAVLLGSVAPAAVPLDSGLEAFRKGNFAKARRLLAPMARAGDPVAQFHLGKMYADGLGVPRDQVRAVAWYRAAAERGHAEAQYRLAVAYALGFGVKASHAEAVRWYRAAGKQGHAQAQLRLGILLSRNSKPELRDYPEAVYWLGAAAEQGVATAQWMLGSLYAEGTHVGPDPDLAVRWIRAAAEQDLVEAQYELGLIYENGRRVRRDPVEARKWFAMAARNGVVAARERLAFDARLRDQHLRNARIFDGTGPDPVRVRDPEEIRRGPAAPVALGPDGDVYCDFYPRDNGGGNPKFRCFMMTGSRANGGRYYDELGNVRPEADGVLVLDTDRGPRPVLATDDGRGGLEPLTRRTGFRRQFVRPLELKVKYRSLDNPDYFLERDMHSEVAATRLLWALHYPVDRMYRVRRIHCHRCPRDPFRDVDPAAEGTYTTFEEAAIELRYMAGRSEKYDAWLNGGWSWGEELHRLRYGSGPDAFTAEQKKHFDGLVVLASLLQHASKRPDQNRLACLRGNIQQLAGPFKFCPDTVLLVNDIGSVFGKRRPDSLAAWRDHRVWADAASCEASLPLATDDEYRVRRYVIGKAGQEFILGLLDQLTDDHLRALFETAEMARYDITLVPPGTVPSPRTEREIIATWIDGFHEKVDEVRAAVCEGS
jgi:TPR repeat protein